MPRSSAGALPRDAVLLSVLALLVAGVLTACGASPAERKADQKAEAEEALAAAMWFHAWAPRTQVTYSYDGEDATVTAQRDRWSRSGAAVLTDSYDLPGTVQVRRVGDDVYYRGDRRFWRAYFPDGDEFATPDVIRSWFRFSEGDDRNLVEGLDDGLKTIDSIDVIQDVEFTGARTVGGRRLLRFRSPAVTLYVDPRTRRIASFQQGYYAGNLSTVSYPKRDVARPEDAV